MRLRVSKLHGRWKELAEKNGIVSQDGVWVDVGLGDVVAISAKPLASILDKRLGTNVSGCSGCMARRQWLNKLTK